MVQRVLYQNLVEAHACSSYYLLSYEGARREFYPTWRYRFRLAGDISARL